ncbi:hypothetical protein NKR23_g9183 [Pleurostoma richardsiae]|uniref:Uncharacterized protein n=1 Tax=Pleurostoma richardsiae TaxID=41990 RepID=A0AA38VEZ5_9PEZI|nr:hypothetical protein NKR23_g9183 [Pleurostoma richardsiae]
MYFRSMFTALVGFTSLVAAAPASVERDATPAEKGLKHKSRAQKRAPLIIQQTVIEQQITVVEENLDTIAQLALVAEQEFAALVQAQFALVQTVETIKNNIRINHFKARWPQVNTVIVTVTNVVDARDAATVNNRYLVNQLLVDNGAPQSEIVVMVTASDTMTINAVPTPTVDVAGLLSAASAVSTATATPAVAAFDSSAPFGQLNQSVILPYNSSAPTIPNNAQVFADPAAIILPNQNLFVEDITVLQSDCQLISVNTGSLFNLQAFLLSSFEAVAATQLSGLVIGSAAPPIPAVVVAAKE